MQVLQIKYVTKHELKDKCISTYSKSSIKVIKMKNAMITI